LDGDFIPALAAHITSPLFCLFISLWFFLWR